jgi:valyl-tRNA synthetase
MRSRIKDVLVLNSCSQMRRLSSQPRVQKLCSETAVSQCTQTTPATRYCRFTSCKTVLTTPQHLHGKYAVHPFLDRRIPIVTDSVLVDMAFGTGAVKITPAHDFNDYEVGKRHGLEFINILNDDGTFNARAGARFACMKRFHARVAVVDALKEKGLYVETQDNPMQIPVCVWVALCSML